MATAHPIEALRAQSAEIGAGLEDRAFAAALDAKDELAEFRDCFLFPKTGDSATIRTSGTRALYLCGNSLGLQPKATREYIGEELDKWEEHGVEGHFRTERPWMTIDETVRDTSAALVGAEPDEVVVMNSLTTNLHLMMVAFYRPTDARHKILIEAHAFPSDHHAVQSQVRLHGRDPATSIVLVRPREGEETLRTEDVAAAIAREGDALALVLLPGVQYYTGHFLDIEPLAAAAHAVGARVGVDLAHAAGNVPLELHAWGVDFACWCSYKYINSGPGGIAGCFVHNSLPTTELPRLAGWWGHRKSDRFVMKPEFVPTPGAAGFQLSNPPVFQVASLRASLDLFARATMPCLRAKSLSLVAYMEHLLRTLLPGVVNIVTPADPARRGCQLSLNFNLPAGLTIRSVHDVLGREGVICDVREPNVMRVATAPLYNNFSDVWEFVDTLKKAIEEVAA